MPRGFLSARIDAGNPRHHLYRNNCCLWWVHYTLHFGGRKRRIRRSLKTSDVRIAIARRDALFLHLRTDGEEVPERAPRRRRSADGEPAMPGVGLRPSNPPSTPHEDFPTMAKRFPFVRNRTRLVAEADTLLAQAKHYVSKAEVHRPPHWFHLRAAHTFEEAAQRYQEAGLGLMAKALLGYAEDCYRRNGLPEDSSRCAELATSLPIYWGEVRP